MSEYKPHQELRPGDPGYGIKPDNQYEQLFRDAHSQGQNLDKYAEGRWHKLLKRLRKNTRQAINVQYGDEIQTTVQDRESLHYLDQKLKSEGLPNNFKLNVHIYPSDSNVDEEMRYLAMNYPVRLADGSVSEHGWETVVVDDHVEVWRTATEQDPDPSVERYELDDWVSMQQSIAEQKENERQAAEQRHRQLSALAEAYANQHYVDGFKELDADGQVHEKLSERLWRQAIGLPFVADDQLPGEGSVVNRREVNIPIDKIVAANGFSDWRGRSGGRGRKSNDTDDVNYLTSGEHIVYLAERKLDGTYKPEKDRIEFEEIAGQDGVYYRVTVGAHRVAAEKLIGGERTVKGVLSAARGYDGNLGELVKNATKQRLGNSYLARLKAEQA